MTVQCDMCGKDLNPHDYGVWRIDGDFEHWSKKGMSSLSPRTTATLMHGDEAPKNRHRCDPCMDDAKKKDVPQL